MGRRYYVLLRSRHDIPIRCRQDELLRRLGDVPLTSLGVSFETYLGRRWDVQRDIVTTSPRRLAARWVSFEQELHDPVKAVRRIQDFNLAMVKLKLLVEESLENPDSVMTNL